MRKLIRQCLSRFNIRAFLAVVAIGSVFPTGAIRAEQGFGISPPSQTVTLAPDGSVSGQLTVINDGDTNVKYRIYATDYRVTGEIYQGVFTNEGKGPNLSAISWFKLPLQTFTVAAGAETTFPYTIKAPKTAAVGGHYASVFIQTIPPPSAGATFISRVERVGSIFYLTVSGTLKQSGTVLPLDVSLLQAVPPVKADLRFKNSGNVHFLASGTAQLSTPFGKAGMPVDFNGEILPSTTRELPLSLPTSSAIGLFEVTVHANYLGRNVTMSRWMVLVPRLTFIIVAGTLLLILALSLWQIVRRARRTKLKV
jgi:hypothetical protein